MRECVFKIWTERVGGKDVFTEHEGYFHCWGLDNCESGSHTIAIVEDKKTGKVYRLDTDRITFKPLE